MIVLHENRIQLAQKLTAYQKNICYQRGTFNSRDKFNGSEEHIKEIRIYTGGNGSSQTPCNPLPLVQSVQNGSRTCMWRAIRLHQGSLFKKRARAGGATYVKSPPRHNPKSSTSLDLCFGHHLGHCTWP